MQPRMLLILIESHNSEEHYEEGIKFVKNRDKFQQYQKKEMINDECNEECNNAICRYDNFMCLDHD